jgi:hypothetical protein
MKQEEWAAHLRPIIATSSAPMTRPVLSMPGKSFQLRGKMHDR